MTLSAFRLQSCQWALRGGCRRYPCGGALPLQFANCSPAKALFEKSTSALLRNFKHALRITQMSRLIRSKRRLPYKPFKTGDTSLKNLTVSGFPYLKSVTELISAEIAALQSGAVGTAGNTTGSVPIGTAESGIQRNFTDLLAVPATQLAAPGAIALMMVVKRVFHDYPSHKPMRLISQAGI